jgi:hypothetical protein
LWTKEDPHNGHAHIPQGVYIGSVGARFQRPGRMKWEQERMAMALILIDETNPRTHYLRIWSEFYSPGYVFPSYEEVMTMRATTSTTLGNLFHLFP